MSSLHATACFCLSCLSLYLAWRIYREPNSLRPKTQGTYRSEMETSEP